MFGDLNDSLERKVYINVFRAHRVSIWGDTYFASYRVNGDVVTMRYHRDENGIIGELIFTDKHGSDQYVFV